MTGAPSPWRVSRVVPRTFLPVALLALCGLIGGCGGGDDDSAEASTPEACRDEPAEPSNPCLAGCGNSLFVGMACSEGGGECSDHTWPEARLCTADHDSGDLRFCTRPCVVAEDCGEDALCVGEEGHPERGQGCFPKQCWNDLWPVVGWLPPPPSAFSP